MRILGLKYSRGRLLDLDDPKRVSDYRLDTDPHSDAMLLVRAFSALDAITGGRKSEMRKWIRSANRALGGPPARVMLKRRGLASVVAYLEGQLV